MRKFRTSLNTLYKEIIVLLPILLAVILGAGIVYAAQSSRINNSVATQVTEHGVCGNITNNSGKDIFIPTNSSGEWSAFRANLPAGVTNTSCCAGNYGNSCNGPANACGQTTGGSYICAGTCSVTTAPGYSGAHSLYGGGCTSPANACGQTQGGTYGCNNTCSASSAPGYSGAHATYGQGCTSAANNCGTTNSGTRGCNNSCSASAPANVPDVWRCVEGEPFCVNQSEVCDYDEYGYPTNCIFQCTDYDTNTTCGYVSGC